MAKVDFGEVCMDYVPDAQVGQYCLIHVGFAISLLDEKEALQPLDLLKHVGAFGEEIEESE